MGSPTFSAKQVRWLLCTILGISAAGGGYAAWGGGLPHTQEASTATDMLQDSRISRAELDVAELRAQVFKATESVTKTETAVGAVKDDVSDIKSAMNTVLERLNQMIGRESRRGG